MSAVRQVDAIRAANKAFSTLVPGHALLREGRSFRSDGEMLFYSPRVGHGKCSCGSLSPELGSNNARKAWHRQHKLDVLAGAA